MSEAENTALARRWFEDVWNTRREATVHEILGNDAVGHLEGLVSHGVGEFLAARTYILTAFPDLRITAEATAAQEENVVVRWSVQGTHGGEFLGVAPTNAPVKFRGITWLRFADGRIVEGWDVWNQGRLVMELQAALASR